MSQSISLDQLKALASKHSIAELKALATTDPKLAGQIRFSMPVAPAFRVHVLDADKAGAGATCCAWGKDPEGGEWVCLRWGPC